MVRSSPTSARCTGLRSAAASRSPRPSSTTWPCPAGGRGFTGPCATAYASPRAGGRVVDAPRPVRRPDGPGPQLPGRSDADRRATPARSSLRRSPSPPTSSAPTTGHRARALAAVRVGVLIALALVATADRLGRRRLIRVSAYAVCAATATGALVPNLAWLGLSQTVARGLSTALALLIAILAAEFGAPELPGVDGEHPGPDRRPGLGHGGVAPAARRPGRLVLAPALPGAAPGHPLRLVRPAGPARVGPLRGGRRAPACPRPSRPVLAAGRLGLPVLGLRVAPPPSSSTTSSATTSASPPPASPPSPSSPTRRASSAS